MVPHGNSWVHAILLFNETVRILSSSARFCFISSMHLFEVGMSGLHTYTCLCLSHTKLPRN